MLINHQSYRDSQHWAAYRAKLLASFEYSPKVVFQVDPTSLGLIAGKALKLTRKQIANQPLPIVEWRTTDNQIALFTGEEFLLFADAAEEYAESIYKRVWGKKDGD